MKIATLQFSPQLGAVQANMARADAILAGAALKPGHLDLLVLPELAFTGYNFPNLAAISPHLEPTAAGPTTEWAAATAQQWRCHVVVGYPEKCTTSGNAVNYNASVTVSPTGRVLTHYRKCFLYYTDETWASEGPGEPDPDTMYPQARPQTPGMPFFCGPLQSLQAKWNVGFGICMDINPYRFMAPWTDYEFATAMRTRRARLVVLCMAWLTRLSPHELQVEPDRPDMETVAYWLERFFPFVADSNGEDGGDDEGIVVVFANRCGMEEGSVPGQSGDSVQEDGGAPTTAAAAHAEDAWSAEVEKGNRVCYAGSSCVMKFQRGRVRMFERGGGEVGILGKGEEGLLVVDTGQQARFLLQQKSG